jgi:hypothetical protein
MTLLAAQVTTSSATPDVRGEWLGGQLYSGSSGTSASSSPVALPGTQGLERPPHNLPLELSSFVGRERETSEIEALLAGNRLLTLLKQLLQVFF